MSSEKDPPGYGFGPFRLQSAIDLSHLHLARQSFGIPVRIRLGSLDMDALGGIRLNAAVTADPRFCALAVPGLARFVVFGGNEVLVDAEPDADMRDVAGYLTAWVFGALCHQHGMLPLHASAVARHGAATAFLGDSGAGKSTFAAFLSRRGYTLASDDICLLQTTPQGMEVVPVAAWLKLWRGTLEALGEPVESANQTFSDEDKFRVYRAAASTPTPAGQASPVLRHLVFVERGEAGARLERLSNAATLARLMGTIYLGYCMQAMQIEQRVFTQCAQVVEQAQGWVLTAPWGFAEMPAVLDLLETRVLNSNTGF